MEKKLKIDLEQFRRVAYAASLEDEGHVYAEAAPDRPSQEHLKVVKRCLGDERRPKNCE